MKDLRFLAGLVCAAAMGEPACSQTHIESSTFDEEDLKMISAKVSAGDYGAISSLWIERGEEVLFYEHYRGTDETNYHNMRSVGKTVTGMLLGAAIDDGLVASTDVKAAKFFKDLQPFENADTRKSDITLEHLLSMSGPLECDDFNSYSRGNEERMYLVEDWSKFFWDLPIKNRPSWEIPDNDGGYDRLFSYCTAGSQLIGEIVERVSGQPANTYAQKRLFDPIGIKKPKWNYAATGKAHLGGGLELTTQDWAKIGRLMVNDGRNDDRQVLSSNWVHSSFTSYTQASTDTGYGFFWWRPEYNVGDTTYVANMMSGTGGNRIYILPEFETVVVITKNDFRDRNAHDTSDDFFQNEIISRLERK